MARQKRNGLKQNNPKQTPLIIIIAVLIVIGGIVIGRRFLSAQHDDKVINHTFDTEIPSIEPDTVLCDIGGRTVYIYTIDSCEYIGSLDYGGKTLTHRARCKYCIERNK